MVAFELRQRAAIRARGMFMVDHATLGETNGLLVVLARQGRSGGLDPALALLSALGSFPMAPYCARLIAEAALCGRAGRDRTLAAFLFAAPVAWISWCA